MAYQPIRLYGAPGVAPVNINQSLGLTVGAESEGARVRLAALEGLRTQLQETTSSTANFQRRQQLLRQEHENNVARDALREQQRLLVEEQKSKQSLDLDNWFATMRAQGNKSPMYAGTPKQSRRETLFGSLPEGDVRRYVSANRMQLGSDPKALDVEMKRLDKTEEQSFLNTEFLDDQAANFIKQGYLPSVVQEAFERNLEGIPRNALEVKDMLYGRNAEHFRKEQGLVAPASTVQAQAQLRGAEAEAAQSIPDSFLLGSAMYQDLIDPASIGMNPAQFQVNSDVLRLHEQQFGPVVAQRLPGGGIDLIPDAGAPDDMKQAIDAMEDHVGSPLAAELGVGKAMAGGAKVTDTTARKLAREGAKAGPPPPPTESTTPAEKLEDQFDLFKKGLDYFGDDG